MVSGRFDALARAVGITGRRAVLGGLLAGLVVLVRGDVTEAARRNRRTRRLRRRIKRLRRRGGSGSNPPPGANSCAGTNGCGDSFCQVNGVQCFCRIDAESKDVFCGGTVFDVLNCDECGPPDTCVDLSACGGQGAVGCAAPCG